MLITSSIFIFIFRTLFISYCLVSSVPVTRVVNEWKWVFRYSHLPIKGADVILKKGWQISHHHCEPYETLDEEHRESEIIELTRWRPLKGDCFPRNTSTLRLKLALTLSPSVDSNARHLAVSSAAERNAVSCCSLIDPRYSWHESAWNGAHRWNSRASTLEAASVWLLSVSLTRSRPGD